MQGGRSAADDTEWTFLNLPAEDLEFIGQASLKGGDKFYFTVDTYREALADEGVYDTRLAVEGAGNGGAWHMDKRELFLSRDVSSAHAMAMCGVETAPDGSVVRWVAENSFGLGRRQDGYIQMQGEWWRKLMFRMAVDKKYLSESQLRLSAGTPELIPYWNLY